MIKPFDIVKTPGGGVAMVTEVSRGRPVKCVISYFAGMNPSKEHNAWWSESELKVKDSLLRVFANSMAHPMGQNTDQGERYFT